jgi:hypothetical protein
MWLTTTERVGDYYGSLLISLLFPSLVPFVSLVVLSQFFRRLDGAEEGLGLV